jgi:hypothetical protein
MKNLLDLSKYEYEKLMDQDLLFRIYPEATGVYEDDCKKANGEGFNKVEENDIEK